MYPNSSFASTKSTTLYLLFAEMKMFLSPPDGFKGNQFHYWPNVFCFFPRDEKQTEGTKMFVATS